MKILDNRQVEYAYAYRIVIYPNQKVQKEKVIPEDATPEEIQVLMSAETEFEYVTKMTITYDLQDSDNKHLEYSKENHTLPSTETAIDTETIQALIGNNLKDKVAIDKLKLSGFVLNGEVVKS
jgi:hypothetical protein